ncbi:tetratricopeptide repeat protein [Salibaculum halophilum]|uniref:tetratricopeptide repeat protein n=1 Tax=Salibaculum halophilum TaxID=1914408 RepID=UPI0015C4ACCF|nr:tetratricopeptide repeat protein [Salibaculum halophilum]
MLREAKAELRADLEAKFEEAKRADAAEREALRTQIDMLQTKLAETERRLADPEAAYREYQKTILELEQLLEDATDATSAIGTNRIADARAEAVRGDYAKADRIFAEVQELEQAAVKRAAEAAHGRGLIAEEEIRWHDAARHYADAARLDPGFDTLFKAREYAWRAGKLDAAHRYGADLLACARDEGTQKQLAEALNGHALTINAQGRYAEAETLYRQAMKITSATIGEEHPAYATCLNNLATVLQAQGRYSEAEGHYRQALEIDRATLGEGHPNYAIHLANLGGAAEDQGRVEDAEELYRQAMEIDLATVGEAHPAYATGLNNLAGAVLAQGRVEEAEGLVRQALQIGRETLGEEHPSYAIRLGNLGRLLVQTERVAAGRGMLEQALAIFRATLPEDHPSITDAERRLADLPADAD